MAPKPEYEPKTVARTLGYLVEECGEVLAAVGKSQRWGLECYNPELPEAERETNRDWILRELADLCGAIVRAEIALNVPMADLLRRMQQEDDDVVA